MVSWQQGIMIVKGLWGRLMSKSCMRDSLAIRLGKTYEILRKHIRSAQLQRTPKSGIISLFLVAKVQT